MPRSVPTLSWCSSGLAPSACRNTARWSSSEPSRKAARRSYSTSENRHGRSFPSAVRRKRLHELQKCRDSGVMKPTVPKAFGKWKYSAGPQPIGLSSPAGTSSPIPSARAPSFTMSKTSLHEMTPSLPQLMPSTSDTSPIGMCSMKRTCSGRSIESFAKSRNPSESERSATALIFTGLKPTRSAASMPASAPSSEPQRVILWNFSASSVSSEMFTRESPAAFKSSAMRGKRTPFVVIDTFLISGMAAMLRTSSTTPLRTVGSPPVRRTLLMPMLAATRTACSTSSMRKISKWESCCTPSSGMQYTQRKLQRSVSEIRR